MDTVLTMSGIASMEDCNYEVAVELFESLKYDLLMTDAPINGSIDIYCDNDPVLKKILLDQRPANYCCRNTLCRKEHAHQILLI